MSKFFSIAVGVGIVLLLGAIGLWKIFGSSQTPDNGVPNTSGQPASNYNSSTNVQIGSGQTSSTSKTKKKKAAVPSIDEAYQEIYVKLSGSVVLFTSASSSAGSLGSIYALYSANVSQAKKLYPNLAQYSIDVAVVDLNGDNVAEALVYDSLPGFCGTGGCSLDIFQKKSGQWVKISSLLAKGVPGLANTVTGGYQDLLITNKNQSNGLDEIVLFVWDGSQYKASKSLAVWAGDSFILSQQLAP